MRNREKESIIDCDPTKTCGDKLRNHIFVERQALLLPVSDDTIT